MEKPNARSLPPRVLHLLGRRPDLQAERAVEALLREPGAARADVGPGGRWRNVPSAVLGLRSAAAGFDVVQCWDDRALVIAALSAGGKRIVFSPQEHPSRNTLKWVNAVRAYRDVRVVCPSATAQRAFLRRGVPMDRCHVVRPGVDFARVRRRRDPALRAALGLPDDAFVLLAPGESSPAADHLMALRTVTILFATDPRYRLLIWGRGQMARHAAAIATGIGYSELVTLAEQRLGRPVPFESLLAATDAVLATPSGPAPTLATAVCMAAALPIVATVTPTLAELLEDRHNALMVPERQPRMLAERVFRVREDPQLQWKISDTARAEAYEHLSMTRFLDGWREVYGEGVGGEQRVGVERPSAERLGPPTAHLTSAGVLPLPLGEGGGEGERRDA